MTALLRKFGLWRCSLGHHRRPSYQSVTDPSGLRTVTTGFCRRCGAVGEQFTTYHLGEFSSAAEAADAAMDAVRSHSSASSSLQEGRSNG